MKKLRVMTIVGTRPEIIRLSRIIARLDEACEHILVHTGQNYDYELSQIFFDELGVRQPDHFLNVVGKTTAQTIANIISKADELMAQEQPSAVLVLGDTNSCLSVMSAKRRKIPIFHLEAGNRCFDMRVPEEINRKIVDHLSDINLPYSDIARQYLLHEGFPADQIIKVGSPLFEVLHYYRSRIASSQILSQLGLDGKAYFLVSSHREETIDSDVHFSRLCEVLNRLAEKLPVIVSTHPRSRQKIEDREVRLHKNIRLLKPFGFFDYNALQANAKVVLSDSGTITEESAILDFPALNIREAYERPEGMEESVVMLVGQSWERIEQALLVLETQQGQRKLPRDYQGTNVSEKVVQILHSYVDYVQRVVWKQY